LPWSPRVGGEYDYASGKSAKPNVDSTFDQQYPSNHNAFGLSDLFGFQNIRQTRINVDLASSRNLTLLLQAEALNLSSRQDSLYGDGGAALAPVPAAFFASTAVGKEIDVSGKYVYHDGVVFNAGVGRLLSGPVLISSGLANKGISGYFSVTYRFKIGD
jgi:Alginate export